MTTRTGKPYAEALRAGRVVNYRGRRREGVTVDAELWIAVEHAAADFDLSTSTDRGFAIATDLETGEEYGAYCEISRTAEQLSSEIAAMNEVTWSRSASGLLEQFVTYAERTRALTEMATFLDKKIYSARALPAQ